MYGKIPPQAVDLEEAVLGAIMLERDRLHLVLEIIANPQCFYSNANQHIFQAIKELDHYAMPVDLLTVTEQLRKNDKLELVGGAYYLTKLTMNVVSSAHVEAHCRLIIEAHMKRQMIILCGEVLGMGYDSGTDAFDLLEYCESNIMNLSNVNTVKNYKSPNELVMEQQHRLRESDKRKGGLVGMDTGYHYLNYFTGGWRAPHLIVIAARPAVGKTGFTLNLAMNAARDGNGIGIFSLEMSADELMKRILSRMSGVPIKVIENSANMTNEERTAHHKAMEDFRKMNVRIDDTAGISAMQLRSKARRMVQKDKVQIIFIDYLQLMQGGREQRGQNREAVVSAISRELKILAKDLNIPVIALSQLNRQVENRKDANANNMKVPNLSDLRESGAIEQDADMVLFLYGPSDKDKDPNTDEFYSPANMPRYIDIAKNRSGACGTVLLNYNMETQHFFHLEAAFKNQYSKTSFDEEEEQPPVRMPSESLGHSKLFIQNGDTSEPPEDLPF